MKKICEAAALDAVVGAIDKALKGTPVPVGNHKLDSLEILFRLPPFCAVARAEGTAGAGYNIGKMPALTVSADALLLFIERFAAKPVRNTTPLWLDCIRDSLKGTKGQLPRQALDALMAVQLEQSDPTPEEIRQYQHKTAAKRIGADEISWTIRRPSKSKKLPPGVGAR